MRTLELLERLEPETEEEKEVLEIIRQDLLTLQAIKHLWLNDDIEPETVIEHITEMLFSDKKWENNNEN